MRKFVVPALLASAVFAMSAPAQAVETITDCSAIGLDDIVPNAQACVGYFDKNVLKTDAGDFAKFDEVAALNALGLLGDVGDIKVLEKLDGSGDFDTLLNGLTWIGVHYGKGQGPVSNNGGVTAFYRFDAGTNLDAFTFTNGSISGVALYATGGGAVPEPATWAMMMGGLGLVGAALRRRATKVQFA